MELIGQQFKRYTKYGPSIWTDTITKVWFIYEWQHINGTLFFFPKAQVTGKKNGANYSLDEIVLVNIDLSPIQKLQEEKRLISEYIFSGKKDEKIADEITKRGIKFHNPLDEL